MRIAESAGEDGVVGMAGGGAPCAAAKPVAAALNRSARRTDVRNRKSIGAFKLRKLYARAFRRSVRQPARLPAGQAHSEQSDGENHPRRVDHEPWRAAEGRRGNKSERSARGGGPAGPSGQQSGFGDHDSKRQPADLEDEDTDDESGERRREERTGLADHTGRRAGDHRKQRGRDDAGREVEAGAEQ